MKKYTKEQVAEAISYWKRQLSESAESESGAYATFCDFKDGSQYGESIFKFKPVKRIVVSVHGTPSEYCALGLNLNDSSSFKYDLTDFGGGQFNILHTGIEIHTRIFADTLIPFVLPEDGKGLYRILYNMTSGNYFSRGGAYLTEAEFSREFDEMISTLNGAADVNDKTIVFRQEDLDVRIEFA